MKRLFSLLIVFLAFQFASGQKVAVVLSGGGAKGATHIGVLKALEEAGIPIDYIAGTSMGAIIGGMYAAGYSPDEMKNIITSKDFTKWISGKLEPEYIYFFREPYPDASWFNFNFKVDSTFQTRLPTNIVSPVQMDFAFLKLFSQASAAARNNYDSLMIPFRCVAADVKAGKPFVMRSGNLGTSIRASMTFPFYFKPVKIDGKLLFDGGMYNNFPSDVVMSDFFPDVIIGSKAAGNYPNPSENDIVSQVTTMLMGETKYDVYCDASVLIEPKLKAVNVIDFSNTEAFIDSGYVAAKRIIPQLRMFILDTVSAQKHEEIRQSFNNKKPELKINSVQISGLTQGQAYYVANAIMGTRGSHNRAMGIKSINIDQLQKGYFKVLGEDRFQTVYPLLEYVPGNGQYKFVMDARHENNLQAQFGGSISSGATNEIFLQLKYNYWRKKAATAMINGYFGRFYNSADASVRLEFPGVHPWYISGEFTYNQFNYFRTSLRFFIDKSPAFLEQSQVYSRFNVGFPMGVKGRLEIGLTSGVNTDKYFQTNAYNSNDTLDKTKFEFFSPYVIIEKNSLNRKQYANQGKHFYTSLHFVSGTEEHEPGSTSKLKGTYSLNHNYLNLVFGFENYFKTKGRYKPGLSFELQASSLNKMRNYTSMLLAIPAYTPVYEMVIRFQPDFRSVGYLSAGFKNVITLYKKLDLRIEGYAYVPFREMTSDVMLRPVFTDIFPTYKYIASACLVYDTPIGPLSFAINKYAGEKGVSFFANLGYMIFNRQSLK